MSSMEEIAMIIQQTNSPTIYYQTSAHIPRLDKDGQENYSRMKVDNTLEVWLMHPDSLTGFKQVVQSSGKSLVEFDLARYLNYPKIDQNNKSMDLRQPCQP